MKRRILLLFLMLSFCGRPTPGWEKPADLIPEEVYIRLLAESQVIESYEQTYGDSLKTDSLKSVLLQKFSVTDSQLIKSHKFYRFDVVQQKKRLEKAVELLEAETERMLIELETRAKQDSTTVQK